MSERTFTVEQVKCWLKSPQTYSRSFDASEQIEHPHRGLAAWCDRQSVPEAPKSAQPPRPSPEWVAAQRWEGEKVELTGECRAPKMGEVYISGGDEFHCLATGSTAATITTYPRWIVRVVEPPAAEAPQEVKTCATCWHFCLVHSQCRKNAPSAWDKTPWPIVLPTDWCGKWRRKDWRCGESQNNNLSGGR